VHFVGLTYGKYENARYESNRIDQYIGLSIYEHIKCGSGSNICTAVHVVLSNNHTFKENAANMSRERRETTHFLKCENNPSNISFYKLKSLCVR
jgi:hypothetical protein